MISEPGPLYLRHEDTPEFQAEAAARREADRMIIEGFAYVVEHGGWFGGELYRPGGELVRGARMKRMVRP